MFKPIISTLLAWQAAQIAAQDAASFTNPIIWNDLADIDVSRVNDTYYYSASSMHFSPGAPTLTSKDLVNWEYLGHSVPTLDFQSSAYSLENGLRAYARGVWASTLRYRQSNGKWYWIGCVDFNATYFYTSSDPAGPFEQAGVVDGTCLYDCGLLIDDDDTMYVTYGSTNLNLAQLTPDGTGIAKTQQVYSGSVYIEGSRMYKRNDAYYIIAVEPVNTQYILKSTSGPFGPYEIRTLLTNTKPPSALAGGDTPHQGGFVDTPEGDWWYIAFVDINSDATGRIPVLTSMTWSDDGWPTLDLGTDNKWPDSLTYPVASGASTANSNEALTGIDTFQSGLGPQYEWNHNPNTNAFSVSQDGVKLSTATVTDDLYQARNTLTRRTLGPASQATIQLDFSQMEDGDRAGLSLFRDSSAWIGIAQDGSARTVVMRNGLTMDKDNDWATTSKGADVASEAVQDGATTVYLRCQGDFRASSGGGSLQGSFSYSFDGTNFKALGNNLTMVTGYEFFQAYRFAVFNYAEKSLGGAVLLKEFSLEAVSV